MIPLLLMLSACDDFRYPQDPENTLDRVTANGTMRAMAVDHDPFVVTDGDRPTGGVEVRLVEAFAEELGVRVEWRTAPTFEALEALDRGDADLAVGGFTETAVTAQGTGAPTYAYFTGRIVVAAKPGRPVPEDLEGEPVFVPPNLMAGGLIETEGGVPVSQNGEDVGLVALHDWQLPATELVPTGIELQENRHVMAIPKGENAWIMRLERFLRRETHQVSALLREDSR